MGVVRSFSSFSDALHEVTNARVFAGIHFRTACEDGEVTGKALADYILANAVRPEEDDDMNPWSTYAASLSFESEVT